MTYVISDVHGDMHRFEKILKVINFSSKDVMYILGDVIDRGKYGNEIMLEIMKNHNMTLILGNHEYMMRNFLFEVDIQQREEKRELWFLNGGKKTFTRYNYSITQKQREEINFFLGCLEPFVEINVMGEDFYLVHGYPVSIPREKYMNMLNGLNEKGFEISYEHIFVWERVYSYSKFFDDKTVVFGHTPTIHYQMANPLKIWFGNRKIGIDCGCAHRNSSGRLGCLRLEDFKEYYV